MKKITMCIFLLGTLLFTGTESFASFINILSQKYTVDGIAFDEGTDPHNHLETYYDTSGSTLILDTGLVQVDTGSEYIGQYKLVMEAGGGATDYEAWVYGIVLNYTFGDIVTHGWTISTMTFQPLVNSVLVTPNCSYHNNSIIRDLTTNETLFYYIDSVDPFYLSLDLDHTYAIEAYTHYDWMGISSCLKIEAAHVPEPATIVLLGFLSLIGVCIHLKQTKIN